MKTIAMLLTMTAILSTIIVLAANSDVYELPLEKGAVVCNEGFFYDMSKNPTFEDMQLAEEIYNKNCPADTKRNIQDYRWTSGQYQGKQKHAVLLEKGLCVINIELSPIGHNIAFNNVCKPKDSIPLDDN